jgi:hypothetical protein
VRERRLREREGEREGLDAAFTMGIVLVLREVREVESGSGTRGCLAVVGSAVSGVSIFLGSAPQPISLIAGEMS